MEEENRFKKARCELNVHGYQSVAQVIKATGVSKTTINELESAIRTKPRNARKETVAKLAEHYGVSVGYLIGVEDTPTTDINSRAAQEYTGLSAEAIESIRKQYKGRSLNMLSEILSNHRLIGIIEALVDIHDYRISAIHNTDILKQVLSSDPPLSPEQVAEKVGHGTLPMCATDDAIENFTSSFDTMRMQLFELSEMWTELVESIIPTSEIVAEGKALYRNYVLR